VQKIRKCKYCGGFDGCMNELEERDG
jgi:hypothetical protein